MYFSAAFSVFDKDKNGLLDLEELQKGISHYLK
jgi:Ca2+-binding EF-hand superfamily protein